MDVCVVMIQPEGSQSCADGLDSGVCVFVEYVCYWCRDIGVADVGTATRLKCYIHTYQTMHDTMLYASSTWCYMLTAFIIALTLWISKLLLSLSRSPHFILLTLSLSFIQHSSRRFIIQKLDIFSKRETHIHAEVARLRCFPIIFFYGLLNLELVWHYW